MKTFCAVFCLVITVICVIAVSYVQHEVLKEEYSKIGVINSENAT